MAGPVGTAQCRVDQPGNGAFLRAYMTQHRTEHRAQKMAHPRKKAHAPPVPTAERATPTRNGPRDAMAEVKPMAPPAWRAGIIIGICLKVPALPKPENRNMVSMSAMKM